MASHFDVLCAIDKADMDAESLERPGFSDATPDGDWDLYLSCATFNSKHWRIERLPARRPEDFSASTRQVVFPGSREFGIKDPVLVRGQDLRVWATLHPLTEGDDNADKMTSVDALSGATVSARAGHLVQPRHPANGGRGRACLFRRPGVGSGELRGTDRSSQVGRVTVYRRRPGPASSPFGGGALRYVSVIALPGGKQRLYYECATQYDSHELRTELRDQS